MGAWIIAGITLEKFGFQKYIKAEAYEEPKSQGCSVTRNTVTNKWLIIWRGTWSDFTKVLPYLVAGIAMESMI